MALTMDGKVLASRGADHALRLWDTATGKQLLQFAGGKNPVGSAVGLNGGAAGPFVLARLGDREPELDSDGNVVDRFAPSTSPEKLEGRIIAALGLSPR